MMIISAVAAACILIFDYNLYIYKDNFIIIADTFDADVAFMFTNKNIYCQLHSKGD
jgi:hypothetical protein